VAQAVLPAAPTVVSAFADRGRKLDTNVEPAGKTARATRTLDLRTEDDYI
jgi:hypothetical protein